ncbi:MAG: hypothetical protein WBQ79_06870 [Acidobacteriaceae bacterium]
MNDKITGNQSPADRNQSELESAPEQSANELAELGATEGGFPPEKPAPMSNPKISVQS